jgi:protein gp37
MAASAIEWTDVTWNPVRGCSRVSEGCRNCYAERQAARFSDPGQYAHGFVQRTKSGARWTGRVELVPEKLLEPLSWRKPRRVFVNSMSDLFHEALPLDAIDRVFAVMALAQQHTFQVLTKRPQRMREYLSGPMSADRCVSVLGFVADTKHHADVAHFGLRIEGGKLLIPNELLIPNVWLGVSVENQETADARIPALLDTPAAVRFVSAEPLLGPIDLRAVRITDSCTEDVLGDGEWRGESASPPGIDWVIVGGESGPGARPCELAWIRSVARQCAEARVPCFVKQLGAKPIEFFETEPWEPNASGPLVLSHHKGGDPSEWPADLRVREFPSADEGQQESASA